MVAAEELLHSKYQKEYIHIKFHKKKKKKKKPDKQQQEQKQCNPEPNNKWKTTGAYTEMNSVPSEMYWVNLMFFWTLRRQVVPFRLEVLRLYEPRMIHVIKAQGKREHKRL